LWTTAKKIKLWKWKAAIKLALKRKSLKKR
jgi:hypothetical protein